MRRIRSRYFRRLAVPLTHRILAFSMGPRLRGDDGLSAHLAGRT
jgi:hypothetical protein